MLGDVLLIGQELVSGQLLLTETFCFPNSSYWDASKSQYVPNTNITVKDGNGNAGFWSDGGGNMDVDANYVTSADFWS